MKERTIWIGLILIMIGTVIFFTTDVREQFVPTIKEIVSPTVELNQVYLMRWGEDSPWYDGSHDIYITTIEIKDGWVRYRFDTGGTSSRKIRSFLRGFEKVESSGTITNG